MASLKRSAAEREVRARGGQATDRVNAQLDYLVIGDTPATGWAHGSYGRKIEAALAIRKEGGSLLRLVSEGDFLAALAETPPTNAGAIDAQVVVVTVKFIIPDRSTVEIPAVDAWLSELQQAHGVHATVSAFAAATYATLYGAPGEAATTGEIITCRLARQQSLDASAGAFADLVTAGFERIRGVDPRVTFFTRVEGSAEYARLLREIPAVLHVPGL